MPLMTRRSSARSTPRTSVGKCGSIRTHCSSLSQNRFLLINASPNTNHYRIVGTERLMSSDPSTRRPRSNLFQIGCENGHLEIIGPLVVFVVDEQNADELFADIDLCRIFLLGPRHHANAGVAEQLFQIGVELSDFLNVHRVSPKACSRKEAIWSRFRFRETIKQCSRCRIAFRAADLKFVLLTAATREPFRWTRFLV